MNIKIPFGKKHVSFSIPDECINEIITPKNIKILKKVQHKKIKTALDNPIGMERIETMVKPGDKVVIIVDDLTRPTPIKIILPELLGRLHEYGIKDEEIKIIVALGTHRPMTNYEMKVRVGEKIFKRYSIINHDFENKSNLCYIGESVSKVPIWINRQVNEADIKIGLGNIVPHAVAGWSGGGKIIYPGVAGKITVDGFHGEFGLDLKNRVGNIKAPIRKEINELIKHIGLDYIINTILTGDGQIYEVVAGDYIEAHKVGVKYARSIYAAKVTKKSDIVISSSFPADIDFWQAGKAVYSSELLVKNGGILILVTPCYEGIVKNHDLLYYMKLSPEKLKNILEEKTIVDRVAAAVSIRVQLVTRRIKVLMVSDGITQSEANALGFEHYVNLQEAVDKTLNEFNKQCTVSILTHGGEMYPEFIKH